jgi:hypothetical protein
MAAHEEQEDYQNADGAFWKGLFANSGGGLGTDTEGNDGKIDPQVALSAGITILGLAGGWFEKRKEQKAQKERDRTYVPQYVPPQRNNTAIYVIGGLAVVGIAAAIYLATKKK